MIRIPLYLSTLFISFCCLAAVPTQTELSKLLEGTDFIDWSQWPQNPYEFSQTRIMLEKTINAKTQALPHRLRAIEELGRLAVDDDGNVYRDVVTEFNSIANLPVTDQAGFSFRLALLKALRNANSFEGLELLANQLNTNNDELTDFALRMIDEIIGPRPLNAPAPRKFEPSLGIPLDARGGNEQEWINAAEKLRSSISQLLTRVSPSSKLYQNAQHSLKAVELAMDETHSHRQRQISNSGAESQTNPTIDPSKNSTPKNLGSSSPEMSKQEATSLEAEKSDVSLGRPKIPVATKWAWLVGGIAAAVLITYLRRKK